jgi:hypothetical protein
MASIIRIVEPSREDEAQLPQRSTAELMNPGLAVERHRPPRPCGTESGEAKSRWANLGDTCYRLSRFRPDHGLAPRERQRLGASSTLTDHVDLLRAAFRAARTSLVAWMKRSEIQVRSNPDAYR